MNIILWFLFINFVFCEERFSEKERGFLLSLPKTLINGKNETVCLSLHLINFPCWAIIELKWKNSTIRTFKTLKTDQECFSLHVPFFPIDEPQFVKIKTTIKTNYQFISARNQDPILLYPSKPNKTFIQTDRYSYKPGDTLKIRIITLNNDLIALNETLPEVKLKNPMDVTVAVWENLSSEFGLIQLEYSIVQESITGKWSIEANSETTNFEIDKYVLPKFDVKVFHPRVIYYEVNQMIVKVCAKYSYGKPVNGYGLIKVMDSQSNMATLYKRNRLTDGCTNFLLSNYELNLENIPKLNPYDPKIYVHITATVTEDGTSRIQMSMVKTLVALKPYGIKLIGEYVFLPGMPYKGKLQLINIHVDPKEDVFEICYSFAINKSWNYVDEQCSNFTIDKERSIDFNILPLQSKVVHINLSARSLNYINILDNLLVLRQYSSSNRYFHIENVSNDFKCNKNQNFIITLRRDKFTTRETIKFYYIIKSKQQLNKIGKYVYVVDTAVNASSSYLKNVIGNKHKYSKNGILNTAEFTLDFDLNSPILTSYQLLVYFVTKGGETIASMKNVDIEPCFKNKVTAHWLQNRMYPGSIATLNLKSNSDSLCSISSVDKSVFFMSNPHLKLDEHFLVKPFMKERDFAPTSRKICIPPTKKLQRTVSYLKKDDLKEHHNRTKRFVYSFAEDFDTFDIFNKFGTIVITNLKTVTKPCYTGPVLPNEFNLIPENTKYDDQNEEKGLPIRSFFPETWLWDLVKVEKGVTKELERFLPHSITTWVTNVMCVSPINGVGFSKEFEITAFQPFFVDVTVPYSIKQDESFYLYVNLFNYLNYSLPIQLKIDFSKNLELGQISNSNLSVCLQDNGTSAHLFHLKGLQSGQAKITVYAEIDTGYPRNCGPESVVNKRDVVQKSFIIEPEGYPIKVTKSAILCSSGENNISWEISVPEDIVPNTDKAHLVFNGDLLGCTIENIENLLSIPTGCGEQIMASVAPNLYILRYLEATNKLTTALKAKIIKNLKIGYQRILNYCHKDGSFSAFGYHDPSGSMFLTAFVVRTLKEAKNYIYVDQRILDRALHWIYKHQLENGCFNAMLHVFQDMGGASTENSTATLTAYVMLTLEEANVNIPSDVKKNAKYCIRSLENPDKYSLAISCYALFKVNWFSEASRMLKRLMLMSNQQQNLIWWSNKDSADLTATDLEITGYVLLSLLHRNTSENLANAHSVVRWLTSKQGPRGGFKTTQDTVVVLDALSKYATILNEKRLNAQVQVYTNKKDFKFLIRKEDKMKSKRILLGETNDNIQINVTGDGCILAQLILSHYIKTIKKSDAFKLDLDIAPVSTTDPCSITSFSPCVAYTGPDTQSNMAVLEVSLPSGYTADRSSLYKLVDVQGETRIKMFEEVKNQVVLYFTKLNNEQVCFTFNINENSVVETRKDSVIKLYDYYKPEYENVQLYQMNKDCSLKNKRLPALENSHRLINFTNDIIDGEPTTNKTFANDSNEQTNISEDVNITFVKDFSNENMQPKIIKRDIRKENINNNLLRIKRQLKTDKLGLNSDFVDMDMEMATPNGMEGTKPIYVKPGQQLLENIRKEP
ncbi:unnamed protein product [Brassicogethes aeneus]|uniref:Uncharacterized protein n=1 Tax=Brassicogethes aeneus TaxID=1431903 RepID=A0A9P0AZT1_BRAAE|nr:unnamed protein product [Brassicogethes aeneus]